MRRQADLEESHEDVVAAPGRCLEFPRTLGGMADGEASATAGAREAVREVAVAGTTEVQAAWEGRR